MALALSFGIEILLAHIVAYVVSFDSHVWTLRSDLIRPRDELFNAHAHSCLSLSSLSHTITFYIMALALSFGIEIFLAHIVAYVVSFDSQVWILKSDIVRPRSKLSNAHGHSCLSLPSLSHTITYSIMALTISFGIKCFSVYIIAYIVKLDSQVWTLKSDLIWPQY